MTVVEPWDGRPERPEVDGWHWVNGTPRFWSVFDDGAVWVVDGLFYKPTEFAHRTYGGRCTRPTDRAAAVRAERARIKGILGAYDELNRQMCCDGRECCCQGSTLLDEIEHYIDKDNDTSALDAALAAARIEGMEAAAASIEDADPKLAAFIRARAEAQP